MAAHQLARCSLEQQSRWPLSSAAVSRPLVAIASFLFVVVYLSGFAAPFVLRVREPELPRPFRMWGYPWTNLAVLVASAAFLVGSVIVDLKDALFTLVLIALSYPIYFLAVGRNGRRLPQAAPETLAADD